MLDNIIARLDVTDRELENFKRLKTNYTIKTKLFEKDNIIYGVTMTLEQNSLNSLFNMIDENDIRYTLKTGNRIIYRNKTKKQIINLIGGLLK